jgi:hypothetical protein
MARLEHRIELLESRTIKFVPREIRLLSGIAPDYEAQLAAAREAGAGVIVMVPLEPLPQECTEGERHEST